MCRVNFSGFRKHLITKASLIGLLLISACDGSVQLCGEYACVFYQSECDANRTTCAQEPKQCEAVSSIRDRAPRIIEELRKTQRSCAAGLNASFDESDTQLRWDETLFQISNSHSLDMASNQFESFIGTDGLTTSQRAQLAGVESELVTESITTGPQTVAEAINSWLDIATDCRQLMDKASIRVGMACAVSNANNGEPYWSLLLAGPEPTP